MTIHHDKLAYGRLASLQDDFSEERLIAMASSLAAEGTRPDYENSSAGLACSILHHFEGALPPEGKTLGLADRLLEGNWRNIVLLVLDGMGMNVLRAHLRAGGFFRSNLAGEYSSVFPPTTVAATTSLLSGLTPNAHGWLGWTGFCPQTGQNVVLLTGEDADHAGSPAVCRPEEYLPYVSIIDTIRGCGAGAFNISPFLPPYPRNFSHLCSIVCDIISADQRKKFIYAYWPEPDAAMHRQGTYAGSVRQLLADIEAETAKLCGSLTDTLVLITADHGMIDAERSVCLADFPEIRECLVRMPSVEPRALNLFVKPGKEEALRSAFAENFPDFRLYTKEELLRSGLLGIGPEHPRLPELLGDFFAVATGETAICNTPAAAKKCIGVHAGLTEDELRIPLIAVRK